MKFLLAQVLVLFFSVGSFAATCTVECSVYGSNVWKILNVAQKPLNSTDYQAYCYSLGGSYIEENLRLSSGVDCMGSYACVQRGQSYTLVATGSAYGSNIYEARQNTRQNCIHSLPAIGHTCSAGVYSYSPSDITFREDTMKCAE
jgi:hypothetical protein